MATAPQNRLARHLAAAVDRDDAGATDADLLARFLSNRDDAALAALVRRHAPMVWGVCRRLLTRPQDAEDAFQATFLVLVRKAGSISPRGAVGNWLHGVARLTATRLRATNARTARRERQVAAVPDPVTTDRDDSALRFAIDAEVARLPEKYRAVVLLCDLQGLTRSEAARRLGLPEGSVASRLNRARAMLGKRLVGLGVLAAGAGAGVPTPLMAATIQLTGGATGAVPAAVSDLTDKVLLVMTVQKLRTAALASLAALTAWVGGWAFAQANPAEQKAAKVEAAKVEVPVEKKKRSLSELRLGARWDDVLKKYGKPEPGNTFQMQGIWTVQFRHSPDIKVSLQIDPKTNLVGHIDYVKKTPFTGIQIVELLDRNAEGSRWWPNELSLKEGKGSFQRLDGGMAVASGGKDEATGEYRLSVTSASVLRGAKPNRDNPVDVKAQESLKELD